MVGATDAAICHVKDFYFDDRAWVARYLVIEAGEWLSSRKVLVDDATMRRVSTNTTGAPAIGSKM